MAKLDPEQVYGLVREVRKGNVASYGMIASLLPGVTARMVGRALSQLDDNDKTPWHRIVNASGAIAPRPFATLQRDRLAAEGVAFKRNGCVDWKSCAWRGPGARWVEQNVADPIRLMEMIASWPQRR